MRIFAFLMALLALAGTVRAQAQAADDSVPAPTNVSGAQYPRITPDLRVIFRNNAQGAGQAAQNRPRRFGGPIVLNPDDVQAYPEPPQGIVADRADVPHGKLEMIEYDSKTVGTRRKMYVYTPPGYSPEKKYPVLYLLHGIGGDETEWQRFAKPNLLLDNLLAEGKAVPMIIVMPNGRAQKDDRPGP